MIWKMEINQVNFLRNEKKKDFMVFYKGYFERFNAWKSVNKNLKTLLAVGGWVWETFAFFSVYEGEEDEFVLIIGYGNERFCGNC
jgi:GH18 family chitinase